MSDQSSFGGARNLVDLIDNLVEPAPPPPVSMIPQTAGWWVLGLLVIIAGTVVAYRRYLTHQRNAYRAAALAEIDAAATDTAKVAAILRRTALVAYPRRDVAGLSGEAWLQFLDRESGTTRFSDGPGRALLAAPYQPAPGADAGVIAAAKAWVRDHKGQGAR